MDFMQSVKNTHTHTKSTKPAFAGFLFSLKALFKIYLGHTMYLLPLAQDASISLQTKGACLTPLHFCPHMEWSDRVLERESCFFWQMGFFRVTLQSESTRVFLIFPQLKKAQTEYFWIVKPRFSQDEFAKNKMLKFYSHCFLHLDLRFLFVDLLRHWAYFLLIFRNTG